MSAVTHVHEPQQIPVKTMGQLNLERQQGLSFGGQGLRNWQRWCLDTSESVYVRPVAFVALLGECLVGAVFPLDKTADK